MKQHSVRGLVALTLITCLGCAPSTSTGDWASTPGADSPSWDDEAERRERVVDLYGKLPLTFVRNRVLIDERVRFLARSARATV
jgi:hypothetical protein